MPARRTVLGALVIGVGLVAAALLYEIIATVFLAVTVGYVMLPVHRRLETGGIPSWWAALVTSISAFVAALLLFVPIGFVLYFRRSQLLGAIRELPLSIEYELFGSVIVVDMATVVAGIAPNLTAIAVDIARTIPVLASKLFVFAFVVFALMAHHRDTRRAVLAPIPRRYHDVAEAIHRRVRATLFGLYVAKLSTTAVTYLFALVVFGALDYPLPFTLALLAALLRLLPLVSPILLILGLVGYHLLVGQLVAALVIGILGGGLIVLLPERVLRPRVLGGISRLPSTVYFTGFVGGLLTIGLVGMVAGPLAVAILAESLDLLARERNG